MAVKIRLRRQGNRNRPFYRVVVTDARSGTSGRFIENIGWYDPLAKGTTQNIDMERFDYWKGNGAIPSDTVKSIVKKEKKAQA